MQILRQDHIDKIKLWKSLGYKDRSCAVAIGVTQTTFRKYLKQGEREFEDGLDTLHSQLYSAYCEGRSENEVRLLTKIDKAGDKDWKAAAFLLKTEFKNDEDNYNDKSEMDANIDDKYSGLTREEIRNKILTMMDNVNKENNTDFEKEDDINDEEV